MGFLPASPPPILGLPPQGLNSLGEATHFHSNELQPSCTKLHVAVSALPGFITLFM